MEMQGNEGNQVDSLPVGEGRCEGEDGDDGVNEDT